MTSTKAHKDGWMRDFDILSVLISQSRQPETMLIRWISLEEHDDMHLTWQIQDWVQSRGSRRAESFIKDSIPRFVMKKKEIYVPKVSWEGTVLLFLLDMQFEIAKHLFSSSRNRAKVIDWLIAQLSFLLLISVSLAKLNPTEMYSFLFSLTTRS